MTDAGALTEHLKQHRPELTGHCYRMLGSAVEAEDAVQETMMRAWKGINGFDGRAALRTWLYRIATNVCLDTLSDRKRRVTPFDEGAPNAIQENLVQRPRTHWLEPLPDASVVPETANPAERAILRQSIRLAFVAALQHLAPKQRAVLLLTQVVGCSATETAECLETSVASVNSALQRARATLAAHDLEDHDLPLSERQSQLLTRYVEAFERYDIDALMSMLREDATHCMPPYALWLRGPATIGRWMLQQGAGCRGSRLIRTAANGLPAFGQYRAGGPGQPHQPWAVVVLELSGNRIARVHNFLDVKNLFPIFGLPPELAPQPCQP